jgi:hypothetical protein
MARVGPGGFKAEHDTFVGSWRSLTDAQSFLPDNENRQALGVKHEIDSMAMTHDEKFALKTASA